MNRNVERPKNYIQFETPQDKKVRGKKEEKKLTWRKGFHSHICTLLFHRF
jgi:hypothetical protein